MEKSSCIVSEFAGCARSLSGSFTINPYDIEDIASKIDEAININNDIKQLRMQQSFEYVQRHSTLKWAQNFLLDLKRAYDPIGSQY